MFRKTHIHLKTAPSVLKDDIKSSYTVRPSSSIYYGRYPYKITFDTQIVNDLIDPDVESIRLFDYELQFEFQDFARNFYDHYKFICQGHGKRRVYLSNIKDLEDTLAMYGDWVSEVQGPVDNDHLDLLKSNDLHLEVKAKPWYNKYEYKLELWASYFAIRNLWLTSGSGTSQSKSQWKDQMKEELSNFIQTIEAQEYDAKIRCGQFDFYNGATLFFRHDDFQEIMTFKTLIIPDYKTKLTKVII